ncbi:MAG TPA: hypothetical protein VNZ67_05120, partial [bacterium]|nr:hypothetical protein [bacterium]
MASPADTWTSSASPTPSNTGTATPTPSATFGAFPFSPTRTSSRTPTFGLNLTPDYTFTRSPTPTFTPTSTFVPISNGNGVGVCWQDSYAPAPACMYFGLALAPGGGVIVGGANPMGQPLLRRFGVDGTNLWNAGQAPKNIYGSGSGTIRSLAVAANGDIYVGGNASLPNCVGSMFLQRYNASGSWVWDAQDCGLVDADSVSLSGDGRLGVSSWNGSSPQWVDLLQYDLNGVQQWSKVIPTVNGTGAAVSLDSTYDACGRFWATIWDGYTSTGSNGVVAMASDGSQQDFISLPTDQVAAVTMAADGSVLVADGNRVRDFRSDGALLWSYNAVSLQKIWCLATDQTGAVYACGDNGTDMAALKLSSGGASIWTWIGPVGRAERMAIDDQGSVWLAGDRIPDGQGAQLLKLCQAPMGAPLPTAACQTFTGTPTFTASPTPTSTRTVTATFTHTKILTPTWPSTHSSTPSATLTPTFTATETATDAGTATPSNTDTFTDSPTPTFTATATEPDTATPSNT